MEKNTTTLKRNGDVKKMNNVIIGDIHSSANELQKIIDHFGIKDHKYTIVSDSFDRGTDGVEVWKIIQKNNIKGVLSNHELKMLDYLEGRRDNLPAHYFQFLNRFSNEYNLQELIDYVKSLPLIIKLDDNGLVVHGGILPHDPWKEDLSANVYGRFDPNKPMPKNIDSSQCWWNIYKEDTPVVYYGHITCPDIRIKYGRSGKPNSYGLDTSACHGNMLTSICHETGEIFQVKSKDYFSKVKTFDNTPKRCIVEYNMKARTKWLDSQSKMY